MAWALPLLYGGIAYVIATILHTVLVRRQIPKQHERYRDELLQLFFRRMQCTAEIADIDQRLVEVHAAAPDEQALWIATTAESAALLPARMRELARRFRFMVPEPPPEQQQQHAEVVLRAVGTDDAVPQVNAWGGPQ